jgi:peptidylprolyl isomerase
MPYRPTHAHGRNAVTNSVTLRLLVLSLVAFATCAAAAAAELGCTKYLPQTGASVRVPCDDPSAPSADRGPAAAPPTVQADAAGAANTLAIKLDSGTVLIKLRPDLAPKHVERFKQLAKEGFYDGIKFHRVIAGFMAQTGDPTGTGEGGSKYPNLPAEFSQEPYKRGTVGAARTTDPNSANSQFFICFTDTGCRGLTGQYTVWGQVIDGMEVLDRIAKGEPPAHPDVMRKAYLVSGSRLGGE